MRRPNGSACSVDHCRAERRRETSLARTPRFARLLSSVLFVNPDDLRLNRLQQRMRPTWKDCPSDLLRTMCIEAANEAYSLVEARLKQNLPVGVESVLSTDKYCPLMEFVQSRCGFIGLIYVGLSSPSLAMQRVRIRISRGGHGVPEDKIAERWRRSLEKTAGLSLPGDAVLGLRQREFRYQRSWQAGCRRTTRRPDKLRSFANLPGIVRGPFKT